VLFPRTERIWNAANSVEALVEVLDSERWVTAGWQAWANAIRGARDARDVPGAREEGSLAVNSAVRSGLVRWALGDFA
jgi:hypothetical protein